MIKLSWRNVCEASPLNSAMPYISVSPLSEGVPFRVGLSPVFKTIELFSLLVVGSMALGGNLSQAQSPPQKPQIPTELESLEYFEGTWNCQQPAGSTKASGNFSWTVKQDLNQFWYLGRAEQTHSPINGLPINSREFMGYDTASKRLVRSVVVGNGNSYNLVAEDWQNNKLIWSGIIVRKGQATPLRQEIIKNSPDKFTTIYSFPNESEEWIPIVDETCDRSTSPQQS